MLNPKLFKALPFSFRGLSTVLRRDFGIYTNETLKKNFDNRVKEKYVSQQKQREDEEEAQTESIHEEMKKLYDEAFSEIENDEGSPLLIFWI